LVAKGFSKHNVVDYGETFEPIARLDTIRVVLAIKTKNRWKFYQMDLKSTFLNGSLEEVYVDQRPIYVIEGNEDTIYILNKSLYRLKKHPRAWYNMIDSYLINTGFNISNTEPTLYTKVNK